MRVCYNRDAVSRPACVVRMSRTYCCVFLIKTSSLKILAGGRQEAHVDVGKVAVGEQLGQHISLQARSSLEHGRLVHEPLPQAAVSVPHRLLEHCLLVQVLAVTHRRVGASRKLHAA